MTATNSEKRVFFHRSWRSLMPHLLLAAVVSAGVAWLSLRYSFFSLAVRVPMGESQMVLELPLFLLVLSVMVIRPLLLKYDDLYEVGEHHVYATSGRFSLHREHYEIPFEDIKGVRVRQSILQRILGVGDIVVWTAIADRAEVVMEGLRHPEIPLRVLRDRIDQAILEMGKRNEAWAQEKLSS